MSLKNIIFKHTNSETNNSIHDFVALKLSSLEKYIGDETDVKVEVEFEKIASHKSGPICRVEVNLWLAGTLFRAESTQETFEAAVDIVKDELDQAMRRKSEKRDSLFRRGARKIKDMMRFGK